MRPGYFLAISRSGTRLYSTNGYSRNITVVDLTNMSVTAMIPMNSSPCGIVLSPDDTRIYVALPEEKAIVALDASTYAARAFIPLNASPYSLAVSPDGTMLYSVSRLDGTISVIGIPGNQLLSTVSVGAKPDEALAIRDTLFVACDGADTVYVLGAAGYEVKAAVKGVTAPSYLAFDVSKNALIVTSLSDKNITKIDAYGYDIAVTRAFWSSHYGRPAVSTDGSRIYVPDDSGKIRVMNASSLVETGEISMAYPVTALAYMPPQPDVSLPSPSPTSATPIPSPSGITGPTYLPVIIWASPTPFAIPLPIPPRISPAPGLSPGNLPYRDWVPPIEIRQITSDDILLVLLCFAAILVVLSGIAYMMMFRKKKE